MTHEYKNEHCRMAAEMLSTKPDLLDYRLVDFLNEIDAKTKMATYTPYGHLVSPVVGLQSRQIVALAVSTWLRFQQRT